ncbi:MAG: hypothetical protein AB7I19_16665 [Planctomycetota bacterium]
MTDELPELEPLEPISASQDAAGMAMANTGPVAHPGLSAPAYNLGADKEYYRFLFAGVVITVGSLMPYGPEWDMAGYKTLSGSLALIVGIGMIWTWWGAISTNRFRGSNLKWVAFALLPLIINLFGFMSAFQQPAVVAMREQGVDLPADWSEFFSAFFQFKDQAKQAPADNLVRALGAGKFVVFLGAVWAEIAFFLAVFGGAKTARAQKAARVANAAANKAARKR